MESRKYRVESTVIVLRKAAVSMLFTEFWELRNALEGTLRSSLFEKSVEDITCPASDGIPVMVVGKMDRIL